MRQSRFGVFTLVTGALVCGSLMAEDRAVQPRQKAVQVENTIGSAAKGSVKNVSKRAKSQLLGAHLSKDGMLTGRLNVSDSISGAHVAAENLNVKFVQRGSIVAQSKPGPGGVFQADGLTPGVYTMIASGSDGYFVTTLVVYPYETNAEIEAGSAIVDPLQIDATVVHPSNIGVVAKLLQKGMNPKSPKPASTKKQVVQASRENEDETPAPLQTPVLTVGNDGRVVIAVDDVNPATGERVPAKSALAYLIQRGAVRGKFQVDEDGSFNAKDITPGQYSIVILTQGATLNVAAMGVIVEKDSGNSGTVNKSGRLEVQQAKVAKLQDTPTFSPAPTGDVSQTADPGTGGQGDDDDRLGGAMFGGGGGGGGFGGLGGGMGGLGGLASLAGIAGLAAGVAALSNNNNNNTPASP